MAKMVMTKEERKERSANMHYILGVLQENCISDFYLLTTKRGVIHDDKEYTRIFQKKKGKGYFVERFNRLTRESEVIGFGDIPYEVAVQTGKCLESKTFYRGYVLSIEEDWHEVKYIYAYGNRHWLKPLTFFYDEDKHDFCMQSAMMYLSSINDIAHNSYAGTFDKEFNCNDGKRWRFSEL